MYTQLPTTSPQEQIDIISGMQALINKLTAANIQGTHWYAGGVVPWELAGFGNDSVGIANQIWVCELQVPFNTLVTGLAFLIGTVGGTDKAIAIFYDGVGNVLANSALAGTTVGTASTFQRLAFVTAHPAGIGLHYVGIQTNGTTARLQTQQGGNHNAGVITGQTFGTPTAITPPSTFTANSAPVVMTY